MALSREEKKRRKIARHVQAILDTVVEGNENTEQQKHLDIKGTAERVARMLVNETLAYPSPPKMHITTVKPGEDGIVAVGPVSFSSTCAHHLMPFLGNAYVAYLPNKHVVGLSKIPRIVDHCSRRLQLQERLTRQVMDYIVKALAPRAALVTITASHECMGCRGVKQPHARTTTSLLYPHPAWTLAADLEPVPERIQDELYKAIERCRTAL